MDVLTPSGHVVLVDDDVILPGSVSIGSHGYAQVWLGGGVALLHRWLLGLTVRDGRYADHINRDRLDNRRANLRVVTASENLINRAAPQRNLPRGVYRHGKRYKAEIKRNRVLTHLGVFDTVEEAAAVRAVAENR